MVTPTTASSPEGGPVPAAPLKLVGAPGSPYSRKLRAVLRYRRISHRWILRNSKDDRDIPPVRVPVKNPRDMP